MTLTTIDGTRTEIEEVYFHRVGRSCSSDICLVRVQMILMNIFLWLKQPIMINILHENKLWFFRLSKSSDSII